jgi:hypothetical protein
VNKRTVSGHADNSKKTEPPQTHTRADQTTTHKTHNNHNNNNN